MSNLFNPVTLGESTAVQVRYSLGRTRRDDRGQILIIKYEGICRPGVPGEVDGRFMLAMGKAGLTAWEPDGLVIDLGDFDCKERGESLTSLLYLGEGVFGTENLPQAVGPRCGHAIRTFFDDSGESSGSAPTEGLCHDIRAAIDYVEKEMIKLHDSFSGRASSRGPLR